MDLVVLPDGDQDLATPCLRGIALHFRRLRVNMLRCLRADLNGRTVVVEEEITESALKFPCCFPIKAMGEATADFDALVVGLIRRHSPDITEGAVRTRLSRGGRYMSVTVTIQARSRAQLDAIYMDLSSHDRVLVAL